MKLLLQNPRSCDGLHFVGITDEPLLLIQYMYLTTCRFNIMPTSQEMSLEIKQSQTCYILTITELVILIEK